MPRLELYDAGDSKQELMFEPSDGDLRLQNGCTLQRYENNCWQYVGDMLQLFNDVIKLQTDNAVLMDHMRQQEDKDRAHVIADKLEDQFDDLATAGEHLRQLEKMLLEARKSYNDMTIKSEEKLKTFRRLDTPYPDNENGPGYQI